MYTLHGNWTLQNSPRVSAREVDWLVPNFLNKRFPDFSIKSEWSSVFWSVHNLRYLRTLRVLHSVTSVTWCRGTRGNQLSARTFCFQLLSVVFSCFQLLSLIFRDFPCQFLLDFSSALSVLNSDITPGTSSWPRSIESMRSTRSTSSIISI